MNAAEPGLLTYLSAIGAIATPVLVLALTGVGWTIRSRMERIHKLESQLRDERIAIYNELLEPIFLLLSPEALFKGDPKFRGKNKNDVAVAKFLSFEYKKTAFRMSLLASDDVVRSYNNLMQFFYAMGERTLTTIEAQEGMKLLGQLLLDIRKSMGNETTALTNIEMLEWHIKDVRAIAPSASKSTPIPNGTAIGV